MPVPFDPSFFDSIAGLPVHPFVVPLAAVLLPLTALTLIIAALSPRVADRLGWPTILLLTIGTAAAFVANESGHALALRVGEPQPHATIGRVLPWVAAALLLFSFIWLLVHKRAFKTLGHRSSASSGFAALTAVIALVAIAGSLFVAYLGIHAAWGKVITPAAPANPTASISAVPLPASPSPSVITTPSATTSSTGYTMAEVGQHNTVNSCWIVVLDQVYDITPWLNTNPTDAGAATPLCGTDASDAFDASVSPPMTDVELANYVIGPLR